MAAEKAEKLNPVARTRNFFRDSYAELKKVHHPTWPETVQATTAVLIMVVVFSLFLGLVDFALGAFIQQLLG